MMTSFANVSHGRYLIQDTALLKDVVDQLFTNMPPLLIGGVCGAVLLVSAVQFSMLHRRPKCSKLFTCQIRYCLTLVGAQKVDGFLSLVVSQYLMCGVCHDSAGLVFLPVHPHWSPTSVDGGDYDDDNLWCSVIRVRVCHVDSVNHSVK